MNDVTAKDHVKSPERVFLNAMRLHGDEPAWLASLRDSGRTLFTEKGLPGRRVEAWKYSDLRRIVADADLGGTSPAVRAPELTDALLVHIADGRVQETPKSLPAGLSLVSLRDEILRAPEVLAQSLGRINLQADHAVAGLNMALWEDGLVVRVAANTGIDAPLHVAFDWSGESRHMRLLVLLEPNASLTLIEHHAGAAGGPLSTLVSEIRLAPNARLAQLRVETLGLGVRQSTLMLSEIARDASFEGASVSRGAGFARRETRLRLDGPGASARLNGVQLVGAGRHTDDTVVITHAAPHCMSRQAYRSVAEDRARGVMQGRVEVGVGAAGTDARQGIKGLLLGPRAEIDAKPELEILADDVVCAHGTAIGELDAAALFYLRARGIPESEARALLIEAFLEAAFDDVADARLKELAEAAVRGDTDKEPAL